MHQFSAAAMQAMAESQSLKMQWYKEDDLSGNHIIPSVQAKWQNECPQGMRKSHILGGVDGLTPVTGALMAITVVSNPVRLAWANFVSVPVLLDPNDGTPQDCVTGYDFNLPATPPRVIHGKFALADPLVLTITPNARIRIGAPQTEALLAHEQFHYDVGMAVGRAVARELMALRARDQAALIAEMQKIAHLHFTTRTRLIQRRYDIDTQHSANHHFQRIWLNRMSHVLGNPASNQIGGFWL
jgi:hypothetical protein